MHVVHTCTLYLVHVHATTCIYMCLYNAEYFMGEHFRVKRVRALTVIISVSKFHMYMTRCTHLLSGLREIFMGLKFVSPFFVTNFSTPQKLPALRTNFIQCLVYNYILKSSLTCHVTRISVELNASADNIRTAGRPTYVHTQIS